MTNASKSETGQAHLQHAVAPHLDVSITEILVTAALRLMDLVGLIVLKLQPGVIPFNVRHGLSYCETCQVDYQTRPCVRTIVVITRVNAWLN